MNAVILAAGLGTRMRPLTDRLPKPLLPVGPRPLIEYTLLLLKRYGITNIWINLHHLGDQIETALGDGSRLGLKLSYSREPQILGTGGALRKIGHPLTSGTFLVLNADILVDLNLDRLMEYHRRQRAVATMALREDPDPDAWGAIETDSAGRVRRFLGKGDPPSGFRLSKYMFTGVQVLEPRILDLIPPERFSPITDTYLQLLKQEERLFGFVMRGYWQDLGTPERYRETNEAVASGRIRLSFLR